MEKIVILILATASFVLADLNTNVQKQESKQHSYRYSDQKSLQNQKSFSKNETIGKEKSISKNLSKTFSNISTLNKTVSFNENSGWSVSINFTSFLINELRKLGWNEKAFFITNDDLGLNDFVVAEDEEWGSIYNLGKKEALEAEAKYRKKLDKRKTAKVAYYINLLYYTGNVIKNAIYELRKYQRINFDNIEYLSRQAIINAYKRTRRRKIRVRNCHFAGNTDTITCKSGLYTLALTPFIPNLYVNGALWYSANEIASMRPVITLSFSKSNTEALSKLEQIQSTKTVAKLIRDYTQKLRQKGETQLAQRIESKFIEDTLTKGKTRSVNSVLNAISSGSPIAVLKLFQ